MAVPKSIQSAVGQWKGKSKLNLPYLPPEKRVTESDSSLHIETDAKGTYATITYDWHHDGKRQEGTIIVVRKVKSNPVEMAWVDSWHQSEGILYLKGQDSDSGSVKTKGDWAAGEETWGWTIEFLSTKDRLTLKMEVLQPNGDATWAVEGIYTKV